MKRKDRLSYREKIKDNYRWFKDRIDLICNEKLSGEEVLRMKVNYDLFNNKVQDKEFDYVCKPFGDKVGYLPASMQNRDIVSGKIKTLLGMEMQRPFNYKVFSTNPEATTQREKKEFDLIKEYVVQQIMAPIEAQIQQQSQGQMQQLQQQAMQDPNQTQGLEEQVQQIQQQAQEQIKQMTPEEVKRYMQREYQDPAEVLSSQLLEYLQNKCNLKRKFSEFFLNGLLTARSIMYVGVVNDEPEVWVINPRRFNFSKASDSKYIEDSEWAVCEHKMTPSQIAGYFSSELSDKELDAIYEFSSKFNLSEDQQDLFNKIESDEEDRDLSVFHCVWKSLRKIGFMTYIDENGEEQSSIVDENFRLDKDLGDITVEWEWIPEVYEGWKIDIDEPIYLTMRAVPGQFKDMDNLRYCKLPYYGCIYDSYNSSETSLMDRIKYYQYFYNIIMYRLELLLASDKGKKLLMNINNVPDSLGIDIAKWQYFVESSPYIWYNPSEEGGQTQDANTVAKVMDLSLVSDIKKYMETAEYIRQQCGKSVGITDQVEGQIGQYEAVRNTNQALIQSSYILELYFDRHEEGKLNILTALLETAKICYSMGQPMKINYMLDDLSKHTINVDPTLLDNSTLGIFVTNSNKTEKTKELIQQLSQAALQSQTVDFSDIISIINADSVPEAEEILKAAQERRQEQQEYMQRQQQEHEKQMQQMEQEAQAQQFEMQKELLILKEEERRKTEIAKISIMGASFNPDQDGNNNGMNDFLELSKLELERLKMAQESAFQTEQFNHQKDMDIAKANRESLKVNSENSFRAKKNMGKI